MKKSNMDNVACVGFGFIFMGVVLYIMLNMDKFSTIY